MAIKQVVNMFKNMGKAFTAVVVGGLVFCSMCTFVPRTIDAIKEGKSFSEYVDSLYESSNKVDFNNKDSVDQMVGEISDASYAYADENDLEFRKVSLARVVDGDTIVVDIYGDNCGDKSHEYSVRLIGVNTPESVASQEYLDYKGTTNSEEGKAASDFVKEYLDGVDYVYLQKDTSETDKYDRLLRYVWLEVPTDKYDIEEVEKYMLNAVLVKEGYAEVATYQPDTAYADYFTAIEAGTTDDFEIDR